MIRPAIGMCLLALVVAAAPAMAQDSTAAADSIPDAYRPPPGMCRIWLDSVPANRQPAPTDCSTAIRRRPTGARVVFGTPKGPALPGLQPGIMPPANAQPDTHRTRDPRPTLPGMNPKPVVPHFTPERGTTKPPGETRKRKPDTPPPTRHPSAPARSGPPGDDPLAR
ncbi:MAG TPA: hypothetical protein VFK13_05990 [Gemmatimonadaceae bacterium]|nr:hypothetical protein [Gemmatimonadaceae bacterium]